MAWGKRGSGGFRNNGYHTGDCCRASSAKPYHHGGVEGDGFEGWHRDKLNSKFCGSGPGGPGSRGTHGSGTDSGGTGDGDGDSLQFI